MAISATIRVRGGSLDDYLVSLGDGIKKEAMRIALGKTTDKARTQVKRKAAADMNIPGGRLVAGRAKRSGSDNEAPPRGKNALFSIKPKKGTKGTVLWEAAIIGRGWKIPIEYFKGRQVRRGVSVAPYGERRVVESSFMPQKFRAGARGPVFRRVNDAESVPVSSYPMSKQKPYRATSRGVLRKAYSGLPIQKVYGPSLASYMRSNKEGLLSLVSRTVAEQLPTDFANAMKFVVDRAARRGSRRTRR